MDHRQLVLGNAGEHVDPLHAVGDHERHVANDGAREGHLQRQQCRGELVSTQGRKYRSQVHVECPH
jgi:hypothetical protein